MRKLALIMCLALTGCSIVTTRYIRSVPGNLKPKAVDQMGVYYAPDQVPFKYHEIGRVYIGHTNYWADRDRGAQIESLKKKAANNGADGILVVEGTRHEASIAGIGNSVGGQAGDVYDLFAIAIVRQ